MKTKKQQFHNFQQDNDLNISLYAKCHIWEYEKEPSFYYSNSYGLYNIRIKKSRKNYQIVGNLPTKQKIIEKRRLYNIYYTTKDFHTSIKMYIVFSEKLNNWIKEQEKDQKKSTIEKEGLINNVLRESTDIKN